MSEYQCYEFPAVDRPLTGKTVLVERFRKAKLIG
jgi:hypothetical protein